MKCIGKGCKENLEFIKHLKVKTSEDPDFTEINATLFACDCGVQILLLPEHCYEF